MTLEEMAIAQLGSTIRRLLVNLSHAEAKTEQAQQRVAELEHQLATHPQHEACPKCWLRLQSVQKRAEAAEDQVRKLSKERDNLLDRLLDEQTRNEVEPSVSDCGHDYSCGFCRARRTRLEAAEQRVRNADQSASHALAVSEKAIGRAEAAEAEVERLKRLLAEGHELMADLHSTLAQTRADREVYFKAGQEAQRDVEQALAEVERLKAEVGIGAGVKTAAEVKALERIASLEAALDRINTEVELQLRTATGKDGMTHYFQGDVAEVVKRITQVVREERKKAGVGRG